MEEWRGGTRLGDALRSANARKSEAASHLVLLQLASSTLAHMHAKLLARMDLVEANSRRALVFDHDTGPLVIPDIVVVDASAGLAANEQACGVRRGTQLRDVTEAADGRKSNSSGQLQVADVQHSGQGSGFESDLTSFVSVMNVVLAHKWVGTLHKGEPRLGVVEDFVLFDLPPCTTVDADALVEATDFVLLHQRVGLHVANDDTSAMS